MNSKTLNSETLNSETQKSETTIPDFIPDFQADQTAHDAHSALRRSLAMVEHAQHCALLWFGEIMRRGLYRELGYSSILAYATTGLSFSRAKAGDLCGWQASWRSCRN